MSINARTIISRVTGDNAALVNGDPIYVGGARVVVGFEGPDAFTDFQISQDRANWETAIDVAAANMLLLTAGVREIRDRAQWVRHVVATGSSDGIIYVATFTVQREDQ